MRNLEDLPPGYPTRWAADVVLADGGPVHLRPIVPWDRDAIAALHGRLSAETIYLRFFSPLTSLPDKMLERFVTVDYVDRFALVAVLGEEIIAVGRYERLPASPTSGDEAEVAFLVDDAHQGRGLGSVLLEHLAAAARESGIVTFTADTLPGNQRMLRVFHDIGFDDRRAFADGVVRVEFPIAPTPQSVTVAARRERRAAARSIRRLLAPRSIAVIGASRDSGSMGNRLFRSLGASGFEGPVYPVNPNATYVASVRAYPTVLDVPDHVDLAVVAVPGAHVAAVVEQCARKRVGGLVVVSAGFAERDAAGADAERLLVAEARRNGMRVIGPNSMGIVNTDPEVRLNATFSRMPQRGSVGFIAQSGGLGVALLDELARRGVGVSSFVSAGNKADVSGNDLIQYWDDDPATAVILMYIETFGNPRTFARVARRVSRRKPIVAVRGGRTAVGSQAAGAYGHSRQRDTVIDALFRQTGVIRTDTLEELFDVAQVLTSQPLPAGRRVAIVGTSGGPGVLAADACIAAGLEVSPLTPETQARLAAALPWGGSVRNPVDLSPDAPPAAFRTAVEHVLADRGVDAVIALHTTPSAGDGRIVAATIAAALASVTADGATPAKPVLACLLGARGLLGPDEGGGKGQLPSFAFPEAAARALAHVADYAAWQARPEGRTPVFGDLDRARARAVIDAWHARAGPAPEADTEAKKRPGPGSQLEPDEADEHPLPGSELEPSEVTELLQAYGITLAETEPTAGAVRVSVSADPLFGPLVRLEQPDVWGPAGPPSWARTLPLTDTDAASLSAAVATSAHGWTPGAVAGLNDVLLRVGQLAEDVPELAELDLGPVTPHDSRATVASASVRLMPWEPRPELALRRLR